MNSSLWSIVRSQSTASDEVALADPTVKEDMPAALRSSARGAMEEYIVGHDYDELKRCIIEWQEPAKLWQMVLDSINMVFEKSDRDRELLASTLVKLQQDNVVHKQQLLFALQTVLEAYDVRPHNRVATSLLFLVLFLSHCFSIDFPYVCCGFLVFCSQIGYAN